MDQVVPKIQINCFSGYQEPSDAIYFWLDW